MSYLTNQILRGAETIRRNSKITDTPRVKTYIPLEAEIEVIDDPSMYSCVEARHATADAVRRLSKLEQVIEELRKGLEIATNSPSTEWHKEQAKNKKVHLK